MTLYDLTARIALHVPGASVPIMQQALRDAAIEFCRHTWVIREWLPDINAVPGTSTYIAATTTPTQTRLAMPVDVYLGDVRLTATNVSALAESDPLWRSRSGTPTHFLSDTEGSITLYPTPTATGVLKVYGAIVPVLTATEVPDRLVDEWADALDDGALSRLLSIPGQVFSNPQLAAVRREGFMARVGMAKGRGYHGYTRSRSRVRSHNF